MDIQIKRKIVVIGETTYDILFKNNKPFDAIVGGSQLNTAVSLGRMNMPVVFVTQFGDDKIGDISSSFLSENGIDTSYIARFQGNSRVALAFLDSENNADYTFLQAGGKTNYIFPAIERDDIVLFGSSFAIKEDVRDELVRFLNYANQQGAIIVYDPNFRKSNKNKLASIKPIIEENIKLSTIIKGSDEDFESIFGSTGPVGAWQEIKKHGKDKLIFLTANKEGVHVFANYLDRAYNVPKIDPVSTIGAGDNFNAGLIYSLYVQDVLKDNMQSFGNETIDKTVENAICFAQHVCMSLENYVSKCFKPSYTL